MKNKLFNIFLSLTVICGVSACAAPIQVDKDGDGKLDVVCTIYPIYNWVQEIGGEHVNPIYLLDSGIDLHNYTPTVKEIVGMKESDLLIYIGGHSDSWADKVVDNSFHSLNMLDVIGDNAILEEMVEGMQEDDHDEEDCGHDHSHDHDSYDEHIWMSLNNAQLMVQGIVDKLSEIDSENAEYYSQQGANYLEELVLLDETFKQELEDTQIDTIVVADRFPIRYLVEDYDLDYYAAFSGCSSELLVSFETIKFLTDKVEELELDYIYKIEGANHEIAETIIVDTDYILEINSMQSITLDSEERSYLEIMEDNLEVLLLGLGASEKNK